MRGSGKIVSDYVKYHKEYSAKYGADNICILYRKGTFYEMYGLDGKKTDDKYDIDLSKLSNVLDCVITCENKYLDPSKRGSYECPYMMGIPVISFERKVNRLTENNYRVIVIDEVGSSGRTKIRKLTKIISPSMNMSNASDTGSCGNVLVSIYIQPEKSGIFTVSVSEIDFITGKTRIFEVTNTIEDKNLALDEAYRFLQISKPKEVIINGKGNDSIILKDIIIYLELDNLILNGKFDNVNPSHYKISYQEEYLKKTLKYNSTCVSVIEYLDLEFKEASRLSYMLLLKFIEEHDSNVISKLDKPEIVMSNCSLRLDSNTINQLNILDNAGLTLKRGNKYKRFNSLLSVIDFTYTKMGHRLLKNRITMPLIDPNKITFSYNLIEELMNFKESEKINYALSKLIDIQRYHRKIDISILHPMELYDLYVTYTEILKLIKFVDNNSTLKHLSSLLNDMLPDKTIADFESYIKEIDETFNTTELQKSLLNDIKSSFFKKGKNKELDKTWETIVDIRSEFYNLAKELSGLIKDERITVKSTDKLGYFFQITWVRGNKLKSKIKGKDKYKDLVFISISSKKKADYRIISPQMTERSDILYDLYESLQSTCKSEFISTTQNFKDKYNDTIKKVTNFISELDFINSGVLSAKNNNYIKPEIKEDPDINVDSFIDFKDIRNPIIEKIIDKPYITNDLTLGTGTDVLIIYAANSLGKSSFMKAVALNVIMAQAGLYTACSSFNYRPFVNILTRITGNDNLFKSQSSFIVEMNELSTILRRSNNRTLVVGDEICRGTESYSALSIVSATIMSLAEKKTKFITASHLHDLSEISDIKSLNNVKFCHMKITFENDTMKFDRKLHDGICNKLYGLEIAKFIVNNDSFIKNAYRIRNELLNEASKEIHVSKYNPEVFMEKCHICNQSYTKSDNKVLETHHIKFQCSADENGYIDGVHKNIKSNLVVLCMKCHQAVHKGKIAIKGWENDDYASKLIFEKVKTTSKKKKFTSEEIDVIKTYKDKDVTQKLAIKSLLANENIKVNIAELSKIWNDKY